MEDAEIKIDDYGDFTAGVNTITKLNTDLDTQNKEIENCRGNLENEAIFMGPAADSTKESLIGLTGLVNLMVENFSVMGKLLTQIGNNFETADAEAEQKIISIKEDGSFEITIGPAYANTGEANRDKIYNYLKDKGFNDVGIAAIMGNLRQESVFSPSNVQDNMGYTDEDYVKGIKNGSISREDFINDARGFGIAQWTYPTRKANLYDALGPEKIDSLDAQLDFMYDEMGDNLRDTMKNATDINSATTTFHNKYERSDDATMSHRQESAHEVYDIYNK